MHDTISMFANLPRIFSPLPWQSMELMDDMNEVVQDECDRIDEQLCNSTPLSLPPTLPSKA